MNRSSAARADGVDHKGSGLVPINGPPRIRRAAGLAEAGVPIYRCSEADLTGGPEQKDEFGVMNFVPLVHVFVEVELLGLAYVHT